MEMSVYLPQFRQALQRMNLKICLMIDPMARTPRSHNYGIDTYLEILSTLCLSVTVL